MIKIKIALFGNTGVGKSTFLEVVKNHYSTKLTTEIKLAQPLYDVQKYIYDTCHTDKEFHVQDGILLNFLGQHMRQINPNVLREHFIKDYQSKIKHYSIIICSDARPKDIHFIKEHNFIMVSIKADDEIALERRKKRGDITLSSSKHPTEQESSDFIPHHVITNNGTMDDYKNTIIELIERLYRETHEAIAVSDSASQEISVVPPNFDDSMDALFKTISALTDRTVKHKAMNVYCQLDRLHHNEKDSSELQTFLTSTQRLLTATPGEEQQRACAHYILLAATAQNKPSPVWKTLGLAMTVLGALLAKGIKFVTTKIPFFAEKSSRQTLGDSMIELGECIKKTAIIH